jgi:DNA-binding transcriptional LysR family regulator
MNRFDAMQLFVSVAELGSFTAAAAQLGVARSVVTRQIAALEEHLGVKLMVRSTRRLTLTSAGNAYLEKCRVILDLVETAEAEAMEESLAPRGQLRLGVPLSFGLRHLVPLLLEFAQTYPMIRLSTDFSDRKLHLIDEGIDLAIRIAAQLDPGDIARKLGTCRLMAIAAPDYLARRGRPQHPSELVGHPCVGYAQQAYGLPWSFLVEGQLKDFSLPFRLQANNGDALAEAAAQGLGITVLPDFIASDYLAGGRVVTLLEEFEPPEMGIYALLPSNRYMPHRVRALIEFLSARLAHQRSPAIAH